jgi:glutamine---fructose-6-phosphate transaminase (isomerizing)
MKKGKGKIAEVDARLDFASLPGSAGIVHSRWSTHGEPSEKNAHPHLSQSGKIAIVHNGIIENYLELKEELKDCEYRSETDSEVIAHLLEKNYSGDLGDALLKTIRQLQGTYAICAIRPGSDGIAVARNGSPLAIGLGEGENFIGSDVSAFVEHTRRVVYLDDFQVALVKEGSVEVFDGKGNPVPVEPRTIDWDVEKAQKQGYKHFMLKEIHEQPQVVRDSISIPIPEFEKPRKIFIVACGTAGYAGLTGKYILEKYTRIPVEVAYASEFRYSGPVIGPEDLFIAISQSGETADTLAALRLAKQKGAKTLGIINVQESTIARESDSVIYTRAGPEIGVASTKAFLSQLVVLYRIAEKLSGARISLSSIPEKIEKILGQSEQIRRVAKKYFKVYNFLYIGRNFNFPIALEGALKLKEISYIHAEGYASGEMKHGPIALVCDEVPTVAIAPRDSVYPKVVSNMQEIRARNGDVIAIATQGDDSIASHATDVLHIPEAEEALYPLLSVVPLQLFAYHIADLRDCDVDKPRNLAKSVTVE